MEVPLDPGAEARLARLEHLVEYDEWFDGEVEKGLASADQGGLLAMRESAGGWRSS
jgi:predicted transcriptional regulator